MSTMSLLPDAVNLGSTVQTEDPDRFQVNGESAAAMTPQLETIDTAQQNGETCHMNQRACFKTRPGIWAAWRHTSKSWGR